MGPRLFHPRYPAIYAALCLALVLAPLPSRAHHEQTIGDVTIYYGIVTAKQALAMPGEAEAHPSLRQGDTHHLVVTLIDHKASRRIEDANVTVEVRGAMSGVQNKPLLWHAAAGAMDYSQVFRFDRPGPYTIRVTVLRNGAAKPLTATFDWQHVD